MPPPTGPPTEADVERLARMVREAYGDPDWTDDSTYDLAAARCLLAALGSLPPEPEPPQERFYVDPCESPAGFLVCDRTGGVERGHYASMLTAEWVAYLCNINEKWSGIDNLLEEHDRLAARVKELEGELAEVKQNYDQAWAYAREQEAKVKRVRAREREMMVDLDAATAKVRLLEEEVAIADGQADDPGEELPRHYPFGTVTCDGCGRKVKGWWLQPDGRELCERCNRAEVDEDDAQPAEPLFTASVQSADSDEVLLRPMGVAVLPLVGNLVDAYPAGARPAPRAITAEDVNAAILAVGDTTSWDDLCRCQADALNALLAGNKPEGE